jgi:dethiobiotin synthetase
MLKKNSYLILGIGTDIGKTFLVENLCQKFSGSTAIKPIASGCVDADKNSDPAKILAAIGEKITKKNLDEIAPWRFAKPISPHLAGKINFAEVVKFCRKKIAAAKKQKQFLFIESAGGVMTPISAKKTFLDLAVALKIPTILVSSNYVGSINHTLCALEALKSKKLKPEKIILNIVSGENFSSQTKTKDLIKTLENFSPIKIVTLNNFLNR